MVKAELVAADFAASRQRHPQFFGGEGVFHAAIQHLGETTEDRQSGDVLIGESDQATWESQHVTAEPIEGEQLPDAVLACDHKGASVPERRQGGGAREQAGGGRSEQSQLHLAPAQIGQPADVALVFVPGLGCGFAGLEHLGAAEHLHQKALVVG